MRNEWLKCVEQKISKENQDIVVISADLGFGVYEEFERKFPNHFINCGVSEQNMIGLATGLALTGKKVFCYSIANFSTLRCLEQIRNDVCYHNLDVNIVSVGAGFGYGQLGMSHHATEDLSILRCIPNLTTYVPYDDSSAIKVTERIIESQTPTYLRLERGSQNLGLHNLQQKFEGIINSGVKNASVSVFTMGGISIEALKLADMLNSVGRITSVNIVQSFQDFNDEHLARELEAHRTIVCIEENVKVGGLGSWILENASRLRVSIDLLHFGIDGFISMVGDQNYLRKYCKLDSESIFEQIKKVN